MPPITQVIEVLCFICAVFLLHNKKAGYWRAFILFMFLTTSADWVGTIMGRYYHLNNHWLYNCILLIEGLFLGYIFSKIYLIEFNSKLWIISGLAVFVLFYMYETFTAGLFMYHKYSNILLSVLVIVASSGYYYYLLKDNQYINIIKHPPFWFVTGVFFFYFASTAANFFFDALLSLYIAPRIYLRSIIFVVLNLILYSCWTYAFICKYRQTILSS